MACRRHIFTPVLVGVVFSLYHAAGDRSSMTSQVRHSRHVSHSRPPSDEFEGDDEDEAPKAPRSTRLNKETLRRDAQLEDGEPGHEEQSNEDNEGARTSGSPADDDVDSTVNPFESSAQKNAADVEDRDETTLDAKPKEQDLDDGPSEDDMAPVAHLKERPVTNLAAERAEDEIEDDSAPTKDKEQDSGDGHAEDEMASVANLKDSDAEGVSQLNEPGRERDVVEDDGLDDRPLKKLPRGSTSKRLPEESDQLPEGDSARVDEDPVEDEAQKDAGTRSNWRKQSSRKKRAEDDDILPERDEEELEPIDTSGAVPDFYGKGIEEAEHVHHVVHKAGRSIRQTKFEASSLLDHSSRYWNAVDDLSSGLKSFNVGVKSFRKVVARKHEDNTKRLSEQLSQGLQEGLAPFHSDESQQGSEEKPAEDEDQSRQLPEDDDQSRQVPEKLVEDEDQSRPLPEESSARVDEDRDAHVDNLESNGAEGVSQLNEPDVERDVVEDDGLDNRPLKKLSSVSQSERLPEELDQSRQLPEENSARVDEDPVQDEVAKPGDTLSNLPEVDDYSAENQKIAEKEANLPGADDRVEPEPA